MSSTPLLSCIESFTVQTPEGMKQFQADILELELLIEDLECVAPAPRKTFDQWVGEFIRQILERYKVDLAVCQAWHLAQHVRAAYDVFKKKCDDALTSSFTSPDSMPSTPTNGLSDSSTANSRESVPNGSNSSVPADND